MVKTLPCNAGDGGSIPGWVLSTPSPAFVVCRLFDDGDSDQCEVISHCGFDLHFSNNEQC